MDNLVSQTGGSRFLQLNDLDGNRSYPLYTQGRVWQYDKLANLTDAADRFDVILSEQPELDHFQSWEHISAFDVVRRRRHPSLLADRLALFVRTCVSTQTCLSIRALWDTFSPFQILFNPKRISILIKDGFPSST
jgi:hypothetical protein